MLVFITHPKYFDKSKLARKKVDLCYIFNSKSLYNELSKKYKCVNINREYKLVNENFFPSETYDERLIYDRMFGFKLLILGYFYKKRYAALARREGRTIHGYKRDVVYQMTVASAKKIFKKDKNEAITLVNNRIYSVLEETIRFGVSDKYYEEYKSYYELIFNLTDSFYRSYIYAILDVKRGAEVTADILKYNYALNAIIYYRPEKHDIYKNGFNYRYLKVLSRLFVENIHNNKGIKEFTTRNMEFWGR